MSEQAAPSRTDFQAVLEKQRHRIVSALAKEEPIEATPIIQDGETLSSDEYVTLVYELHHVHLAELQNAGVVDFDRHADTVSRGPRFPVAVHSSDTISIDVDDDK